MADEKKLTDHEWRTEVGNWLHHLSGHDPTDIRGMIVGLSTLIHLFATRIPPGPRSALMADERDTKPRED